MVDVLDAAVGARAVGACSDFVGTEAVVKGEREFGAKSEPVVGKKSDGASPEMDVSFDKNVGRAGGVQLGAAAETAGQRRI